MAFARAFTPTDMPSLEVWRGDITTATTDEIIISDGFRTTVYSGQFSYDFFGRVSGILTSVNEFREGTQIYSVTDINVDASQVYEAIQVDGDARLAAQLILSGEDVMEGSEGADYLRGYAQNDIMSGFAGNDTLDGGAGDDTLMGGAGEDTYVFEAAWGQDVIADGDLSGGLRFVDRAAEDLTFADDGGDLVIADDENSVRVIDYYLNGASYDFAFAGAGGGGWSITPSNGLIAEGSGAVALTITRPDPTREATKYVSTTQDQGAANNGDYVGKLNEPLTFAAGEREKTISVDILQDEAPEADETFGVIVQDDPADPIETSLASTTFTIQDDDGAAPGNSPTVSGDTTQTIDVSTSINGAELVSAADVDGDLAFVRFSDATAGTDGGTLTFGGTPISGSFVDVAPADLSRVAYEAGPNGGSNEITAEAFDAAGNDSEDLTVTINVSAPEGPGEIGRAVQGVVYLSSTTGELYTWDPDSDDVDLVGDTTIALTDLAVAPDGTLYGISTTDLYRVDAETAEAFRVGPLAGELFFGVDALTDAQGFDIGPDGAARISSGNNSVVALVDLQTGAVSNPFGPSLRQTETSSGDLWFAQDDRYFVTTNSSVLLTIAPSTFGEGIADNDFISNDDIEGLVSLAESGADQRADLIGFSGNAYYSLAEGALPALPGLELGTLAVGGAITGAALSRADVGAPNQAPDLNLNQSLVILEGETEVYDFEATDDADTEGDGLLYSTTGGTDQDAFVIDALTGELRLKFPAEALPYRDANGDGVYELSVQVSDSGGLTDGEALLIQVVHTIGTSQVLQTFLEENVDLDQGSVLSNSKFSGAEKEDVNGYLEKLYDAPTGKALITRIVENDWSVVIKNSEAESKYSTISNDISLRFEDDQKYWMTLDGTVDQLSIETILFHELQHLVDDFSDPIGSGIPDVEKRDFGGLDTAEINFLDANYDYFGNAVRETNKVRTEFGDETLRGSYLTGLAGQDLADVNDVLKDLINPYLEKLGMVLEFDQAIKFVDADRFDEAGYQIFNSQGTTLNGQQSRDWIYGCYSLNDIRTGAGNDFIIGNINADKISAGADDDLIVGQEGDDIIRGGLGFDRAFYSGSISEYDIAFNSSDELVIEHTGGAAGDGKDTLSDMEEAWFVDAVLDVSTVSKFVLNPDETGTIQKSLDAFDGISIDGFDEGDRLEFVDVSFDQDSLTVTMGSAILDIDVDLDGVADATVTLLGDFEGAVFNVEMAGSNTEITVEFPPENNPPVANADSYSLRPNGVLNVSAALGLLANDSDPDGDALRIASVSNPVNGTVALDDKGDADPNNDEVVFTPATGFSGAAAFDYTVSDGFGGAATATVAVDVTETPNLAPTASAIDAGTVLEDAGVATIDLLTDAGASDGDGGKLGVANVTVTDQDGATVVFGLAGAELSIDPTQFADALTSGESATLTVAYDVTDGQGGATSNSATLTVEGLDGPFTWYRDGDNDGFGVDDAATNQSAYAAPAGTAGTPGDADDADASVYPGAPEINDGRDNDQDGATDEDNSDPLADAESLAVAEDGELRLPVATLLAGDTDPDGDALRIASVSNPVNGTIALDDKGDADPTNDEVVFTPATGFSGAAAFDYTVSDGFGGEATATVNIEVETDETNTVEIITDGDPGAEVSSQLAGGAGDELFISGGGRQDVMTGGGGADTFVFGEETRNGVRERDVIRDFGADDFLDTGDAIIIREINSGGSTTLFLDGDGDVITLFGVEDFDETSQLVQTEDSIL